MSEIIHLVFKPGERALDWYLKDPDTGYTHRANSRAELVRQILLYRSNNNLEQIENLDSVIDEYLCRQSENSGRCRPVPLLKRGLTGFFKGGIMLLRSLRYKVFASQEEAEKRASQCKDCKFNVFPDKRGFIKWADALAEATVGSKTTSNSKYLGNCSVCSCPLKCKVFYQGSVSLSKEEVEQMQEVTCWQLALPRED